MAGWSAKQGVQIVAIEFKIHLQFSTGDGSTESHIQIFSGVFMNPLQRILDQDSSHFLDYTMTNTDRQIFFYLQCK